MKLRRPYALLLLVFAASRACYYALGVRFDARPLNNFFQFVDPDLLNHRLLESLFYLHIQPPGMNLFAGIVLKLFPHTYAAAFHSAYLLLGAASCCLIYHLMRCCCVRDWLAFTLTALFTVSPGVVLFENFLLYEYPVMFLLLTAAAALHRLSVRADHWAATIFFAAILCLVLVRNFFHLIYFLAALVVLLAVFRDRRKQVLLAALGPLLLTCGLYAKNWLLFGPVSSRTWLNMSMNAITAHNLTTQEAESLIQRGLISRVSRIDTGSPIALYRPYLTMPAPTGVPVLDQELTSTGATNFNNPVFFSIADHYQKDAFSILKNYPVAYLRSLEAAWFTYFLPPSDFLFFDLNRPRIRALDRFANIAFFGQFKEVADRKQLRKFAAQGMTIGLVLYTGTYLLVGIPLLLAWSAWYLVHGLRRSALDRSTALLLGFIVFNIGYISAIANFLSSFENNRYRFPCDAFFVVLLGILLERLMARRRPA